MSDCNVLCNLLGVANDIWTVQFSGPFSLRRSFYCFDDLEEYMTKDKQPNLTPFQIDFLFVKGVNSKFDLSLDELTTMNNFKENVLSNIERCKTSVEKFQEILDR